MVYKNKIFNNASVYANDNLLRSYFFLDLKLFRVALEEQITARPVFDPAKVCIS